MTTCQRCGTEDARRPAVLGERCLHRGRGALSACPDLVAHLREHLEPVATGYDADRGTRTGKRNPPAPLSVDAAAAADDLHATLAAWTTLVMHERGQPDQPIDGPDWTGSDIRPASKRRCATGEMVYEDARVIGVHHWHATLNVTRWLFRHYDWITRQDWAAADFVTELHDQVATIRARFPTEQRPVYLPMPCPECGLRTLRRYAPRRYEAPVTIACDSEDCEHVISEDGFDWVARTLETTTGRAAS